MYLESFRHLIEIDALERANNTNRQNIIGENKRISDLEGKQKKAREEIELLSNEKINLHLPKSEEEINHSIAKLTKLKDQLFAVKTQKEQDALENQISLLEKTIKEEEEKYFLNLERDESINQIINQKKNFLTGIANTLLEIKNEISLSVSREERIISDRNLRIESLLVQCRADVQKAYLDAKKKFDQTPALCFLLSKKCSICHMQADSMLKLNLEEGRSIEHCPSCARLMLPETSKIY